MKICLISPPTVTEFNERQVAESEANRLIAEHAPMGILSLAAVLERCGVTPHIVDLNRLYYEYLSCGTARCKSDGFAAYAMPRLTAESFDVFGFSTICSTYPLTLRLAEAVKHTQPGATVMLGGPQASVVDVATLKAFPFVDFIVRGEAEESLPLLLTSISSEGALHNVDGLTYRSRGEVIRNRNAAVIEDLDGLPMAAFHIYPYIEQSSYAALEAGRGCPFACSFCSTNDFFRRRFRLKSPSVLVEQMLTIKRRYGINYFDLIHDMFTVDRRKVLAFCDAVENAGERLYWSCSARTDCLDEELIHRMAKTGCFGVYIGIDSGSERVQEAINKRLDLDEALKRVGQACVQRMNTTVSLITGFPEETKEDLRATVNFLAESGRHRTAELQLHLLAPLAETPLTTSYRDDLIYDEIFSDMSFQGWEQDPAERAMIVAHRDIFTNFYAVPTRYLDRYYLKELREFLLKGMLKHRWLMVLLHRDSGDLVNVFDDWKAWLPASMDVRTRAYYMSPAFTNDFFDYLRSRYIPESAMHPCLVETMVDVEAVLCEYREAMNGMNGACHGRAEVWRLDRTSVVPSRARAVKVLEVKADYRRLLRCLQRRERLERVPIESVHVALRGAGKNIRIIQLNGLSYGLLSSCDGERTVMEIAESFPVVPELADVPPVKAGLYGLAMLAHQGLITVNQEQLNVAH